MSKLTIVANIFADPAKVDFVKTALENLVGPTRKEKGCLQYDLQQDNANPAHFLFFEIWESRELWQDHMNAPHITAHKTSTKGAIENAMVSEMTQIA